MMDLFPLSLDEVCRARRLEPKRLVAPSLRIGHQWIEQLLRRGGRYAHLEPTTVPRLALDLVADQLAAESRTLIGRTAGQLVVDSIWCELPDDGYFRRVETDADLTPLLLDALLTVRRADEFRADVAIDSLESLEKTTDLFILLHAYERVLELHGLIDEPGLLLRAIEYLEQNEPAASQPLILWPDDLAVTPLERRLLAALPVNVGQRISSPARPPKPASVRPRSGETGGETNRLRVFQALGEVNEVREILRRCLADQIPLDEVEVLAVDPSAYGPLFYACGLRYFDDDQRPNGVPLTFADGISAAASRPGRALTGLLLWIEQGFPQRLLVDLLREGLLEWTRSSDFSHGGLARLLRPLAIGLHAENYLPKLKEQIAALRALEKQPAAATDDPAETEARQAAIVRKRRGLTRLRNRIRQLIAIAEDIEAGNASRALDAAERFLKDEARSVNELDQYAAEALLEAIADRRQWHERLGVDSDVRRWLQGLPQQTQVLGRSPRPGHLHVASLHAGGHSGRPRTFVVGLDDRRFPGSVFQDPVLLDAERERLGDDLPTSSQRLQARCDEWRQLLQRLPGEVTLSWPSWDLVDDREVFPSPLLLEAFRVAHDQPDADMETLCAAAGPAVSFAPASAEQALDNAEHWLFALRGQLPADRSAELDPHFPHLRRGREALRQRGEQFGEFSGLVPAAGAALDPRAAEGPVLSASGLETAGRCPLAFFYRYALGLYPPDELVVDHDRWLDPAQFGTLMHDVFRRFLAELTADGLRPEFDRDHVRLAGVLHDAVTQWRADVPPPNENAFRTQNWQMVQTARIFLRAEEAFCRTSEPQFFEVSLGLESVGEGTPLDSAEPSRVPLPGGGEIRLRGRIDRVDRHAAGQYSAWDYKLGSGYGYDRSKPFRNGRRVQGAVYLQMIQDALEQRLDPDVEVTRFGYFFPGTRAEGLRMDWDAARLREGLQLVERLCRLIALGAFSATDDKTDCQYCDYASVCGDYSRAAAASARWISQEDLVALQPFRELRRG